MFENEEKMVLTFIEYLHVSSTPWEQSRLLLSFSIKGVAPIW